MKSPVVLLSDLLTDVTRAEPSVKGIDRDKISIGARVEHEGDGFLTIALPALGDAFDEGLSSGKFTCPPGFRKVRGGAIPRLFSGMFCEVFDSITGVVLKDGNPNMPKCIRGVLRLFKKLDLSDDQTERLDQEAKTKFFAAEATCKSSYMLDDRKRFIVRQVAKYILPNIESFDERELYPRHGPGAVVEQITANQKWSVVMRHLTSIAHLGFDSILWSKSQDEQTADDVPLSREAKLISVPKNSTSRRTITVEPCCLQFIQQGFNTLLRTHLSKCSILRQCIDLNDQAPNQKLALDGSLNDVWATIDLSSASDLLTVELVKLVFGDKPSLLEGLLGCRSTTVRSGKDLVEIVKYAGMGNATTFPVQSVVFACLAIAALIEDKKPSYGNARHAAKRVRVYGDDIVVPTEHAHKVVAWITEAGLKVNLKKSFLSGPFKESCGVDAYMGADVTPVYIRHHPSNVAKREPKTIEHYVNLANMFWMRGDYAVSERCREIAETALGGRLPRVTRNSSILGLHSRPRSDTRHYDGFEFQRWDPNLQRPQLKGWTTVPVFRKDRVDGWEALLKFFVSPAMPVDKEHLERTPVRFKSRIVQRWVAL